jgi:hypothetical protein
VWTFFFLCKKAVSRLCTHLPTRSELAHLGKEKLLFAARDRLHSVRGRTTLLSPSVQVEPLLLPGAMALLHQLKRYDLVVQLSEEGAGLGARQIRTSSRDTLRDFEQDMALATALAQVGACTAQHSTALHDPACTVCGASLGPQAAGRAAACPPTRLPAQLLLGLSVCGACLRKFGALQGERHTLHC